MILGTLEFFKSCCPGQFVLRICCKQIHFYIWPAFICTFSIFFCGGFHLRWMKNAIACFPQMTYRCTVGWTRNYMPVRRSFHSICWPNLYLYLEMNAYSDSGASPLSSMLWCEFTFADLIFLRDESWQKKALATATYRSNQYFTAECGQ